MTTTHNDLYSFIHRLAGNTDPDVFTREFEAMIAEQRRRREVARARAQVRWDDTLALLNEKQLAVVARLAQDEYRVSKAYRHRTEPRVALLLVGPQKWQVRKNRLCRELCMVYPDGHTARTLERTISVEQF